MAAPYVAGARLSFRYGGPNLAGTASEGSAKGASDTDLLNVARLYPQQPPPSASRLAADPHFGNLCPPGYTADATLVTAHFNGAPERVVAARRGGRFDKEWLYLVKWLLHPHRSATWVSWDTISRHIYMHKLALSETQDANQQPKAKWRAAEEHGLGAWGAIAALVRAFHRKHVDASGDFRTKRWPAAAPPPVVPDDEAQLLEDLGFRHYVYSTPPAVFVTRTRIANAQSELRDAIVVDTLYDGFHPAYLYPDRIVPLSPSLALVKWKGLPYCHATVMPLGGSGAFWQKLEVSVRCQIEGQKNKAMRSAGAEAAWTPAGRSGFVLASRYALNAARVRATLPTEADAKSASDTNPYMPEWVWTAFDEEHEHYYATADLPRDATTGRLPHHTKRPPPARLPRDHYTSRAKSGAVDDHITETRFPMGLHSPEEVFAYTNLVDTWRNAPVTGLEDAAEAAAAAMGRCPPLKPPPPPPHVALTPSDVAATRDTPTNMPIVEQDGMAVAVRPWGAAEVRGWLSVLLTFAVSLRVEHKCLGATLIVCSSPRVAEAVHGAIGRHFPGTTSCLFVPSAWCAGAQGCTEPPLGPDGVRSAIRNAVAAEMKDTSAALAETFLPHPANDDATYASTQALDFAEGLTAQGAASEAASRLAALSGPAEELALIGCLEVWSANRDGYARPACDVLVTTLESLAESRKPLDARVASTLIPDAVKYVHRWECVMVLASARGGRAAAWASAVGEELSARNLEVGLWVDAVC